ncbi:tropomyosin [Streptomyces sp. GMY02]|uniref:tropomyosin n=1 Tax=Streptomyces sp. GMY02 TaxID=1333528 RepID=UPI0020B75C3B|nr:tropomyosin [Streptomyces sp. GMY02]
MSSTASGLVPVHIGQPEPGSDRDQALRLRADRPTSLRILEAVDWRRHGLQQRWLGMESSDCAAALSPGHVHNQDDEGMKRLFGGARRRGELALVLTVIGQVDEDRTHNVFGSADASVHLSDLFTSVVARRLPAGTRPSIAPGLSGADRDLAIRLLTRPADDPWWSLQLRGMHLEHGAGSGSEDHLAAGELHPILVDALGDPVVAAWSSPAGDQRWYVIPDGTPWDNVLDWLVHRALPEYVPGALRRARSPFFVDPDLQTAGEQSARQSLEELEARYAEEKQRLEKELREAKEKAEAVRYGLLYGSGTELTKAVAQVLTAAGMRAVDLDEELGGTKSADLLVSAEGASARLVEVKGVSGPAQESYIGQLRQHLDTWPQLRPSVPVSEGVLIVNHQYKLHPSERSADVYTRPEHVASLASLPVTVVSAVQLFNWWRAGDWAAIRTAVLGGVIAAASSAAPVKRQQPFAPQRRWYDRLRK